jgi:transposase InsO family protein
MAAAEELAQSVGIAPACAALAVSRASLYRRRRPHPPTPRPRPRPARALSPQERETALAVLRSERFADRAPAQVYATLLDEGTYLCSIRTFYRLLEQNHEVRERRDQLRHPSYRKPELLATAPNQLWSWDITKLLGPAKWTYYYLYVLLDVFSRYVVGWMLAHQESAALASRLINASCDKHSISPSQLTLHSDRGPAMISQPVAHLLAALGVTKSLSRPHVSNDNPFSEAHFKTLKYCPEFPDRFGSFQDALAFCHPFFDFYNHHHRHSAIGLLTPFAVHYGSAPQILADRKRTLLHAYANHPERFVLRPPQPPPLPSAVWINPPPPPTTTPIQPTLVIPSHLPPNNTPTHPASH